MSEILCLLPGLIDVPLQDLGGACPLEKAPTPTLDAMHCSVDHPPDYGGLETVLLALLGVVPGEASPRGPLEAYSLGYALAPHQLAYSARLISAGDGIIVDVSDELTSDSEGKALLSALPGTFFHLEGPKGVYLTSQELPRRIGCNPVACEGESWQQGLPQELANGIETALVGHEINELRFDLEERPVNGLLLTEGGEAPQWDSTTELGDTLVVTASAVMHGAARAVGAAVWRLPREGRRLENVSLILQQIPELTKKHSRILLDLPYLWQSTYEGDVREKVKTIEWLDRHLLAPIRAQWTLAVHPLRPTDIRLGTWLPGEVMTWKG